MSGGRKLQGRARRRVSTRTALLLCVLSMAGVTLLGLACATWSPSGAPRVLLGAAGTLLCFALPAGLGLLVLDGDQTRLLRLRTLSAPHILYLSLTGALAICPISLLGDIPTALAHSLFGVAETGARSAAPDMALFLPMLLQSALLAPVCEELFFRGYLLGAMERYGQRRAVIAAALLFAAVHGVDALFVPRALFGVLLGAIMLRTGSILAPVLVHGCYNLAVLLASFTGLGGLFSGLTLVSCALRLLGSAAFVVAARRAWDAHGARVRMRLSDGAPLTRRQIALLVCALLALIVSQVLTGVGR